MKPEPLEFSEEELLNSITNNKQGENCRYAFLLGAGASVSSNIPAAGNMAKTWLHELEVQNPRKFKAIKSLNGFDEKNLAEFYPEIYKMKFGSVPQDGYQAIENYMSDDEVKPSIGYTILAQVLKRTSHNVVLTTNFDRLTETALLDFENVHARVIAHESMLNVVPVHYEKPSIIKVHRDMIFSPISTTQEIAALDNRWRPVIQTLFSRYHVIALGYGGNDGGLMSIIIDVLKNNPQCRLFWCYRKKHSKALAELLTNNEIKDRIEPVSIIGFDEFFYKLRNRLGFKLFTDSFEETAKIRKEIYIKQLEGVQVNENSNPDSEHKKAVEELFADTWWQVQAAVDETDNLEQKQRLYQIGIKKFPDSHQLIGKYAIFLTDDVKEYSKAEEQFQKALKAGPEYSTTNGNYALFLFEIRKNYDKAEAYFQKALETETGDAICCSNYANFLYIVRKDYEKAETYFQKAIASKSEYSISNSSRLYAVFLCDVRKDFDNAEAHFQKALKAEPESSANIGNYARFLADFREDYNKAETLYQKALKLEPYNVYCNGNFANLLSTVRKDFNQAELHYQKALQIEPNDPVSNCNYASFLADVRKDYEKAEVHYKKALQAEPDSSINNGNYAKLLLQQGKKKRAEPYLEKAEELSNGDEALLLELAFYRLALFPESQEISRETINQLLKGGGSSPYWDFTDIIAKAKSENCEYVEELERLANKISAPR